MNLNKIQLIGRVTRDPEKRVTPGGLTITKFGVATNYSYTNKEGAKTEKVTFHNIVCFGKVADIIAQYVIKGQEIYVEGRQDYDEVEKDGTKRTYHQVMLENFQFGQKAKGTENRQPAPQQDAGEMQFDVPPASASTGDEDINVEDIPF